MLYRESLLAANADKNNLSGEERRCAPRRKKCCMYERSRIFFRELFTNLLAPVKEHAPDQPNQHPVLKIKKWSHRVIIAQVDHVSSTHEAPGG